MGFPILQVDSKVYTTNDNDDDITINTVVKITPTLYKLDNGKYLSHMYYYDYFGGQGYKVRGSTELYNVYNKYAVAINSFLDYKNKIYIVESVSELIAIKKALTINAEESMKERDDDSMDDFDYIKEQKKWNENFPKTLPELYSQLYDKDISVGIKKI